jgi:outer membrane biosynthesis protein TonB
LRHGKKKKEEEEKEKEKKKKEEEEKKKKKEEEEKKKKEEEAGSGIVLYCVSVWRAENPAMNASGFGSVDTTTLFREAVNHRQCLYIRTSIDFDCTRHVSKRKSKHDGCPFI